VESPVSPDAQAHDDGAMPEPAVAVLVGWLNAHVGLALDPSSVVVQRLPGGNSNLTYLVSSEERQWVLRRPPEHGLDASAHSMAREWRLLNALRGSGVPSATPVAHGQDIEVIGAEFLVTEYLPGSVSLTDTLPGTYPAGALELLGHGLIDALAAIQAVDWRARGLGDFGRPDGFLDRQVPRWEAQYRRHQVRALSDFDVVTDWLRGNRPPHQPPALLHGDYHLDNCLFSTAEPALHAVIDWEMATIGDPLLDLGLALAFWGPRTRTAPGMPRIQAVSRGAGAPSRTELAERYGAATGRDLTGLRWYLVFGFWKLGAIVESAWGQHVRDELRTEYTAALEHDVPALFAEAADLATGAGLDDLVEIEDSAGVVAGGGDA
jgi:aminoglycoside phosphotransferase (APT) family kinase protein